MDGENENNTSGDKQSVSLPSSNVSNVSTRSNQFTRSSSTSTVNQSFLRADGTIEQQQWAEEDETTINRSSYNSSLAGDIHDRFPESGSVQNISGKEPLQIL